MKCEILCSGKNKKNFSNLLSAWLAQRVVKIKALSKPVAEDILNYFLLFFRKNKTAFHFNHQQMVHMKLSSLIFSEKKNQSVISYNGN